VERTGNSLRRISRLRADAAAPIIATTWSIRSLEPFRGTRGGGAPRCAPHGSRDERGTRSVTRYGSPPCVARCSSARSCCSCWRRVTRGAPRARSHRSRPAGATPCHCSAPSSRRRDDWRPRIRLSALGVRWRSGPCTYLREIRCQPPRAPSVTSSWQ
jgi:hypothetical protein